MRNILVAKTEGEVLIYLTDSFNRNEMLAMRKRYTFYCPDCGGVVLLKIGDIKIPHFAHKSLSACGSSEPESSIHLLGKILLHQFFIDKKIPAEIETYLPTIRQRADIFVNRRTAVEFQCSPISASNVSKRSSAYSGQGFEFVWIAGIKETKENCIQVIKLMEYQKEMFVRLHHSNYLILLNPKVKEFQYFSNLFYVSGSRWVGKVATLPIDKQTYPFATPKTLSRKEFDSIYTVFSNARSTFIKSQYFAKKRFQNPFWLLCYNLRLDMRNLPETIGVPILRADCLAEHAVIWQLKMIQAQREGVTCEKMITSGKIKIHKSTDVELAVSVLSDYADFVINIEETNQEISNYSEVLYAIYCKSIGKLRK